LFREARIKAAHAGMALEQHSEVHYSLQSSPDESGKYWRLNIYPGNRRLYHDRQHAKPPFLKVPPDWNLMDVIDSAISTCSEMDKFEEEIAAAVKQQITDAQVSERAYFLWENAGRPEGDGKYFWQLAEKELRG